MWCVFERKADRSSENVLRVIGPFQSPQAAAKWVAEYYTRPINTTATIEAMTSPESAAKPNG